MVRRENASREAHQLKRARPGYVLTVTATTVAFWWLIAASQTRLGGRQAPPPVDLPAVATSEPKASDIEKRIVEAGQRVDDAHRAVEEARQSVAIAQQQWEQWLARHQVAKPPAELPTPPTKQTAQLVNAGKESHKSAAPSRLIVNPQYAELAHTLQRMAAQRDELLQRLTPEHPAVLDLVARMATVDEQLATIPEMISNGVLEAYGAESVEPPASSEPIGSEAAPIASEPEENKLRSDAESSGPTEAEVRKTWDTAEADLQLRIRDEQSAVDDREALKKQLAAIVTAPKPVSAVTSLPQSSPAGDRGALIVGLGILCAAEVVMLRLALALLAAEGATPLASVSQVAALLPVPVFAAFPATDSTRKLAVRPAGSASGLTLLLLACEGTLAVILFLAIALTVRNTGFPSELVRHPIEAMARGLFELHS